MAFFFFLLISQIIIASHLLSCKACGEASPKSFSDCSSFSNSGNTCCFVNVGVLSNNETLCLEIPNQQTFLTPYITGLDIGIANNKIDLLIDCGRKVNSSQQNEPFSLCGTNPSTKEDCFAKSNATTSCCYLENPDNTKFCIINNEVKKFKKTYYGVKVECGCYYINNYIYNLILLFFYLLYIF